MKDVWDIIVFIGVIILVKVVWALGGIAFSLIGLVISFIGLIAAVLGLLGLGVNEICSLFTQRNKQ